MRTSLLMGQGSFVTLKRTWNGPVREWSAACVPTLPLGSLLLSQGHRPLSH